MSMTPALLLSLALSAGPGPVLLVTGEVESSNSQYILAPLTTSGQGSISEMTPEGQYVQPGDVVVQFDASEVVSQIRTVEEQIATYDATAKRDLANLELDVLEARFQREQAEIELEIARMTAQTPVDFIGELAYSENQLTFTRAQSTYDENQQKAIDAENRLADKEKEFELGRGRSLDSLQKWQRLLDGMTISAEQSGFVIHENHPWTGSKFQPGDQAQASMLIAKISDSDELHVLAWINAVDIPVVRPLASVEIRFDALPKTVVKGQLNTISNAGETVPGWGDGLYYKATILLEGAEELPLLPGMSALISIPVGESS